MMFVDFYHESNFALTVRIPSRRRQRQAERHVTVPLTNATFGFVRQQRTPLGQKIEAEKNGDTVLIRGSPVGRGDYDL